MTGSQVEQEWPCLFPAGVRPSLYASPKTLVRWARPYLALHGVADNAQVIAQQLQLLGISMTVESVQHQLNRLHAPQRRMQMQVPLLRATRPAGAPPDEAPPARLVRWLLADIPAAVCRNGNPTIAAVYSRARIRGYDYLRWQEIAQLLPRENPGQRLDSRWVQYLLFLESDRYATLLLLLFGRSKRPSRRQLQREVSWAIWLLPLLETHPTTVYQFLLLILVGRRLSDPVVDPDDAPEFAIASEWTDPQMPYTLDGRVLFARVWTADSSGVSLAYLAVSKGGNRVINQGILLTESLRQRLQPRRDYGRVRQNYAASARHSLDRSHTPHRAALP